jgi:hypothetical protein
MSILNGSSWERSRGSLPPAGRVLKRRVEGYAQIR